MTEPRAPSSAGKIRVAVVGGGCAGMAAAHALTSAAQGDRYEVTVYQRGFRLGGKGASGRGPCARIEEHGLHVWMGFYENAFRLMRATYAELARDPASCPIADWRDAFFPSSHVGLANFDATSDWTVWATMFPPLPGEPGAPLAAGDDNPFTLGGYAVRIGRVLASLFETAYGRAAPAHASPHAASGDAWTLSDAIARAERWAGAALGAVETIAGVAENQLSALVRMLDAAETPSVGPVAERLGAALLRALDAIRPSARSEPHRQRAGEVLEITIAGLVGIFRSGALFDERGFDILDDLDFIDWLRQNGLSDHAAASPFLHGLYSLMFAYEGGDCRRPRVAAGQALRGCMRMFLTYRGAFFWKMQAGMGDIVFAPLYEVLKRRGVRFELFHRLTAVGLSEPSATSPYVARLDFAVQALVRDGHEYAPLVDVHGLPCWPRAPDFAQLVDGERLRERGRDFENSWDTDDETMRSLEVGRDFDLVVLAVGGGAVAGVCAEILERDERWRRMTGALATVATQALQLWLRPPMSDLGWARGEVTMTGFVSPFDTWADMTHLVPAEAWPASRRPGAVAYFCNVLDERDVERCGPVDARHPLRVRALVRGHAQTFLSNELGRLWPRFVGAASATRELFVDGRDDAPSDGPGDPLDGQYFVGNVDPSDRYVQTLPGTTRYRISPLDRTFDNLTIAGDWTDCGLSVGCVESAVMSGLLAANALSGLPRLDSIVGYDHP